MKTVVHIVGARPNFIKAAPLVKSMKQLDVNNLLVHTGQHYDYNMSNRFFEELDIEPDHYLEAKGQTAIEQTADIMIKCEQYFKDVMPDLVIVYGDVNSTIAAAMVAKKLHIQVAHIESGLRSRDRNMPEELNRIMTDSISDHLFITCQDGYDNLLKEGIDGSKCHLVGNTMIDSLVNLMSAFNDSTIVEDVGLEVDKYVLVTMHRPSNVDNETSLKKLLTELERISFEYNVVFPLHPRTAKNISNFNLDSIYKSKIKFIDPVGYIDFMKLQMHAMTVITDSGGVQEESSYFNTPCLTVRNNTERPVTITHGTNKLIGTAYDNMLNELALIDVTKKSEIQYWDGESSNRISAIIEKII